MPATYDSLATTTLGSAQSSVTFSSISGNYTDLVVIVSAVRPGVGTVAMTVNSDTGTNYSRTFMYGTGSSVAASQTTGAANFLFTVGATNGTYSASIVHLMNYSNTTTNKTFLVRGNDPADATVLLVGSWRSTSAITSITLTGLSGDLNSGSTFTLYGIKAA